MESGRADVSDALPLIQLDPALKLHAQVKKAAMARGLLVHPMGCTINGTP